MKSTTFTTSVAIIALLLSMFGVSVSAEQVQIELSAPKSDCLDVPVTCAVELPGALARVDGSQLSVTVRQDGQSGDICGQIVRTPDGKAKLCWVAPKIAAGKASKWTATVSKGKADSGFTWKDNSGEYLDLLFDGSKVTRYMYAYDKSTPERLHETYKVFHHVFDADGKDVITKGPDGQTQRVAVTKSPAGPRDFYREDSRCAKLLAESGIIGECQIGLATVSLIPVKQCHHVIRQGIISDPCLLLKDEFEGDEWTGQAREETMAHVRANFGDGVAPDCMACDI